MRQPLFPVTVYFPSAQVRFSFRTREAADAFVAVLEMRDGTPQDVHGYEVHYD